MTPYEERTKIQKDLSEYGICNAMRSIKPKYRGIYCKYLVKFNNNALSPYLYWMPIRAYNFFRSNNDVIRGTFCLFMAEANFDIEGEATE